MSHDYLSSQRATTRSLLGLVIQATLGLILLLYGVFGRDHAAVTAGLLVLIGVVVWLTLAILYDQHRRERMEAMEAEAFAASDAATSSVFERAGDEIRLGARRLRMTYRFVVPMVSLGVAALLILVGLQRFWSGLAVLDQDPEVTHRGWGIALGLAVSFVGFLFARYVSGMAKQPVWSNLRGGAGFAVAAALLGLTLVVAHFVDLAGPSVVLRYLRVVFPAVMVVLGVEVVVNFLLALYTPRREGEFTRPAFDSRLLGFVAAPDRIAESISEAINYQFGYEVSKSWFYRFLSRTWPRLAAVAILVLWLLTSLVVVGPHERALVLRFGALARGGEALGPGLHVKFPWPIESVEVPVYEERDERGNVTRRSHTVTGVRTLDVTGGSPPTGEAHLWTREHAFQEAYHVVQPNPTGMPGESSSPSRNMALVALQVPLSYVITDVVAYERLGPPGLRDQVLRSISRRELMRYMGSRTVDEVLRADRERMSQELARRISAAFAARDAGVEVVALSVSGVHPPQRGDVARQYENVIAQQQRYIRQVNDARKEAIGLLVGVAGSEERARDIVREIDALTRLRDRRASAQEIAEQERQIATAIEGAGGRAAGIIHEAQAERWRRHMDERARLAAYRGLYNTYTAAPVIFKATAYIAALRAAAAGSRVYITNGPPIVDVDLHTPESYGDVFTGGQSKVGE